MNLLRPLLEPKFLVTLALIGCATWLALARIIDGAAWMGMCSITGAAYGAGDKIAAAATAYAKTAIRPAEVAND